MSKKRGRYWHIQSSKERSDLTEESLQEEMTSSEQADSFRGDWTIYRCWPANLDGAACHEASNRQEEVLEANAERTTFWASWSVSVGVGAEPRFLLVVTQLIRSFSTSQAQR